MKCQHCGHIWNTTSKLKNVTCPSCGLKTSNLNSEPLGNLLRGRERIF